MAMELYEDAEPVKTEVQLFGERLERLGKALQNQDTPLTELSLMAHECGMVLRLGLSPMSEGESNERH